MNLPLRFAVRYLFAKKSHNVINIISAISAVGMATGTAALIIIMSVYNGFDSLVKDSLGNIEPDILVTPAEGKVFVPDSPAFDWAYDQEEVLNMCSVLEENVFINYDGHNGVIKAKGADKVYEEESPLKDHLKDGKFPPPRRGSACSSRSENRLHDEHQPTVRRPNRNLLPGTRQENINVKSGRLHRNGQGIPGRNLQCQRPGGCRSDDSSSGDNEGTARL